MRYWTMINYYQEIIRSTIMPFILSSVIASSPPFGLLFFVPCAACLSQQPLQCFVDVCVRVFSPFYVCLKLGVDVIEAVERNDVAGVKSFIAAKGDLNQRGKNDMTPLHVASFNGLTDIVG